MNRTFVASSVVAVLLLAGCSSTPDEAASPTGPTTAVPEVTVDPVEGVTEAVLPPTVKTADQTCREITDMYDGLEAFGPIDRRAAVEELTGEMTSSAEWAATPPDEQAEILRGMEAAAAQSC